MFCALDWICVLARAKRCGVGDKSDSDEQVCVSVTLISEHYSCSVIRIISCMGAWLSPRPMRTYVEKKD